MTISIKCQSCDAEAVQKEKNYVCPKCGKILIKATGGATITFGRKQNEI